MLCTRQCFLMLTADNICNQLNWTTQEWAWPHSAESPVRASCWLGAEGVTQPSWGRSPSHTKTMSRKLAPRADWEKGCYSHGLGISASPMHPHTAPAAASRTQEWRTRGPPGGHFRYSSNKSRWKPNGEKRNPLHCAREMPRHDEMTLIPGPRERRQI